jgi:hypothetical protein
MSDMVRNYECCCNTRWEIVGYFHADSVQETSSSEKAQKDPAFDIGICQSHKIHSNKFEQIV